MLVLERAVFFVPSERLAGVENSIPRRDARLSIDQGH